MYRPIDRHRRLKYEKISDILKANGQYASTTYPNLKTNRNPNHKPRFILYNDAPFATGNKYTANDVTLKDVGDFFNVLYADSSR